MAEGDVLQIVLFSVLFALAVTAIGKKAKAVVDWCQSLADIMFKFTEYVMKFAPVGVGAAMAYTIAHNEQGLGVLKNLGALVLTLYGALIVFATVVLLPIALIFKVPLSSTQIKITNTDLFAISPGKGALKPGEKREISIRLNRFCSISAKLLISYAEVERLTTESIDQQLARFDKEALSNIIIPITRTDVKKLIMCRP